MIFTPSSFTAAYYDANGVMRWHAEMRPLEVFQASGDGVGSGSIKTTLPQRYLPSSVALLSFPTRWGRPVDYLGTYVWRAYGKNIASSPLTENMRIENSEPAFLFNYYFKSEAYLWRFEKISKKHSQKSHILERLTLNNPNEPGHRNGFLSPGENSITWYTIGTIAVSGTTVTGAGTNFLGNTQSIFPGQALLIPGSGTVKIYEIASVQSATKLTLKTSIGTIAAGQVYAILSFYTDSVPDFARRWLHS